MTTEINPTPVTTVASRRGYLVRDVAHARSLTLGILKTWDLETPPILGLPEIDDRYHVWRVPLISANDSMRIGEVTLDARTGAVLPEKSSGRASVIKAQAHVFEPAQDERSQVQNMSMSNPQSDQQLTELADGNVVLSGRSEEVLTVIPDGSVQLMFTSPPYFNARPDYAEYGAYEVYLAEIRAVLAQVHRVLEEGRFAIINTSPVLLRRAKRSESSKRIGVPFDVHRVAIESGFEFVDDIIWQKPEGAGWATGRGRRFAADRNPLQYKPVPVTEYLMVYRKKSKKLIDWHIRNHVDPSAVKASRIEDGYEKTNIWKVTPAHSKHHPAIFPDALAERVIRYYSFVGDRVLDPYAGSGTVGRVSSKLRRDFVLSELSDDYLAHIAHQLPVWLGKGASDVALVASEGRRLTVDRFANEMEPLL